MIRWWWRWWRRGRLRCWTWSWGRRWRWRGWSKRTKEAGGNWRWWRRGRLRCWTWSWGRGGGGGEQKEQKELEENVDDKEEGNGWIKKKMRWKSDKLSTLRVFKTTGPRRYFETLVMVTMGISPREMSLLFFLYSLCTAGGWDAMFGTGEGCVKQHKIKVGLFLIHRCQTLTPTLCISIQHQH